MAAALSLAERGIGRTGLNPSVGCIIIKDGQVIGRGWTQPGGRPHAEAMALAMAGDAAAGSTVYVTLEPCAHDSARGPACCDLIIAAKPARVVIACTDPDPRTMAKGIAKLMAAGIEVEGGIGVFAATRAMGGYISRQQRGRPEVTVKLATSLDGCIALPNGQSRWITGEAARAHTHLERARHDAILVGGETLRSDAPTLDVRIAGLEERGPARYALTSGSVPEGWGRITAPQQISNIACNRLLVEGGAGAAAAFIKAGIADRLLLYRAPILIGGGKACLGDIGLQQLSAAHGRWQLLDSRMLGPDRMELYEAQQQA